MRAPYQHRPADGEWLSEEALRDVSLALAKAVLARILDTLLRF
jgi:hypothetical protein